jgi:hypothetical protein
VEGGTTLVVLTPEELFQQFLRESTNLPDNTSTWTIQLPSQFLVALNDDITAEITQSTTFSIPSQAGLVTKMDHITEMQLIKNEASKIFTSQLRAKERMRLEISKLTNKKFPALYSSTSQAEQTIAKYKGWEHPDIEIRLCQGVKHPFHITLADLEVVTIAVARITTTQKIARKSLIEMYSSQVSINKLLTHRPVEPLNH